MNQAERECLKILLATAAAELLRDGQVPNQKIRATALSISIASITELQPHRNLVPANGIVYRGRPDFLSNELLHALQVESDSLRNTAVRFHDHLVVSGAPLARKIAFSSDIGELLASRVGPVQPTTKANYLYYDQPGLGIDPHVDNEEFSLNAILMLKHEYITNPSALVLYPNDCPPNKIYLQPGEMIVMFADSIVHARERVGAGEKISIVAFGFSSNF